MTTEQMSEGLAYAEKNYRSPLGIAHLDKRALRENFDLENKDVLEFGCGMGHMSLWLTTEMKANVDAVDIDANHITVAREFTSKYSVPNLTISHRNIIEEPVEKQYDFIILNDVIEHIKPKWMEGVLDILILRNLKPGGVIFFSYPPWEGPQASHLRSVTRIPWIQFFPQRYVVSMLRQRNRRLVGQQDLLTEYQELNHMTNRMLKGHLCKYNLKQVFRQSYSKLNRIAALKTIAFNFFPFKYIVTKELIAFRKGI